MRREGVSGPRNRLHLSSVKVSWCGS